MYTRCVHASPAAHSSRSRPLAVLRDAFGVLDDLPRSAFEVDDATFALMRAEVHSWREAIGASFEGPGL
jgi:hypothetical protein